MKTLLAIALLTTGALSSHADDFSDRREAQQRQFYDRWQQAEQEINTRDEVNVRAGVQTFAARHGGFKVSPEEHPKDGHWVFSITFTSGDNLACSAWQGCANGPISINCIDANLKNRRFGPTTCRVP